MATEKPFDELQLKDDFMFSVVMRNPEYCKILLKTVLGTDVKEIKITESQKYFDASTNAKYVRLDVYAVGDDETIYNVEIQNKKEKALPRRCRYYRAIEDINHMPLGAKYEDLPDGVIVFICTFDYYGVGEYVYPCSNKYLCGNETFEMGEGTKTIFLNTKGTKGDISEELKAFLKYVDTGVATDDYTRELEREVQRVKQDAKWRAAYMTLEMAYMRKMEEGRAEGRAEGREEGRGEGREEIQTLVKFLIADNRLEDLKNLDNNMGELLKEYKIN